MPGGDGRLRSSSKLLPLLRTFYYKHPSFPVGVNPFVKVHENCQVEFYYWSDKKVISDNNVVIARSRDYKDVALQTQQSSSYPKIASELLLSVLKKGRSQFGFTTNFDNLVSFMPEGYIDNPWIFGPADYRFQFTNIDRAPSFFTDIADNWKIKSSKINFINETVEVEVWRYNI